MLVESIDWMDEHLLEHQRRWQRESIDGTPLMWKNMKKAS
jgi:hypothetical protein